MRGFDLLVGDALRHQQFRRNISAALGLCPRDSGLAHVGIAVRQNVEHSVKGLQ